MDAMVLEPTIIGLWMSRKDRGRRYFGSVESMILWIPTMGLELCPSKPCFTQKPGLLEWSRTSSPVPILVTYCNWWPLSQGAWCGRERLGAPASYVVARNACCEAAGGSWVGSTRPKLFLGLSLNCLPQFDALRSEGKRNFDDWQDRGFGRISIAFWGPMVFGVGYLPCLRHSRLRAAPASQPFKRSFLTTIHVIQSHRSVWSIQTIDLQVFICLRAQLTI